MARYFPLLVLVSALLAAYGRSTWSALAGPVVVAALVALERISRQPAPPAPARRRREPAR
jgi:hypothetical protein